MTGGDDKLLALIEDNNLTIKYRRILTNEPDPEGDRQRIRDATVRAASTGNEAWWRCGPNNRSNKMASQWGIRNVTANVDMPGAPIFHMDDEKLRVVALDYVVGWQPLGITSREDANGNAQFEREMCVQYVDILCQRPPVLPEPTEWQQMTRVGELKYPGPDNANWTFNNPWEDPNHPGSIEAVGKTALGEGYRASKR